MGEDSRCESGVEEMSEGAWEEYRRQMENGGCGEEIDCSADTV